MKPENELLKEGVVLFGRPFFLAGFMLNYTFSTRFCLSPPRLRGQSAPSPPPLETGDAATVAPPPNLAAWSLGQ